MRSLFLLAILISCFNSNLFAQSLANIESQRIKSGDKRFVLDGGFNFSYNNNNGNYWMNIGSGINAQFKNKTFDKIYLVIGSYNLARSRSEKFQDAWFLHFRFNYKLKNLLKLKTEALRFESFIQSSRNEQFIVNSRNLIGAGLRLKLVLSEPTPAETDANSSMTTESTTEDKNSKPTIILYLGSSYMYEEEKSDIFNTDFFNHRNSTYVSFKAQINENFSIINNTYFQPLFSEFSDYNFLEQLIISTKISDEIQFNTQFNYFHDNKIPGGGKYFTSGFSAGVTIALEKVAYNRQKK